MEKERQHLVKANFGRIIMPSVIREGRQVLPRDFVDRYKDQLSDTVRIDLPVGASWNIGLKKSGHLLFLDVGWEKFMNHHSIRLGYFLFFKFKGNSRFDLHIFDLTCVEIQYPLGSPFKMLNHTSEYAARKKQCLHAAEVKEEEEDESISDYLGARCRIGFSKQTATSKQVASGSSHGLNQHSTSKIKEEENDESISEHLGAGGNIRFSKQDATTKQVLPLASSKGLNQQSTSKKNKCQLGKNRALEQAGETALSAEMMYKTDNPFFIAKMKKYNVTGTYTLNLPAHFGKKIVTNEARFIEIQDPNENKWHARCIINDSRVLGIGAGWPKFAKVKGLEVDDVCVFELIRPSVIKVSISCPTKNGSES